jgi:hypothetical protein
VTRREVSYQSRGTSAGRIRRACAGRIDDGTWARGAAPLLSPRSGAPVEDSLSPGLAPWANFYRPDGLSGRQFRWTQNRRVVCGLLESK